MTSIYAAREDTGKRVLLHIECDECNATIKPHPEIAQSGWKYVASGRITQPDYWRTDYCPECWDRVGWKYDPMGPDPST